MHRTEVVNIQARYDSQMQMKDLSIKALEDKVSEMKANIKELKTTIVDKANEFEYFVKEENIRSKEHEFKVKLEADKSINSLINEKEETEARLRRELDKEKEYGMQFILLCCIH